jgi:hypothetical protein
MLHVLQNIQTKIEVKAYPRLLFSRLLRVVNTCTTRGPREEYAWNTRGPREEYAF